ncbi:Lacal_2735 family protein [Wenyingzhuangia sp. chi5]|uniref:Lacal_2735 family protein n=1 Tax=Wenyingzhuangia gilva TaxID=3057677 RepID=A0ABT8VU94_9FLAO|nr:Lacal_2735 family protein [Wenyingzhuangia sp. chi5]MDO3695550.1 Lacal_2735 family protein [Wenyingzhuangia sp. chi5]
MILPFLIKIPIKKLQRQHQKLLNEALSFFNKNKNIAYAKIEEAEKIAIKIQRLKKHIVNH